VINRQCSAGEIYDLVPGRKFEDALYCSFSSFSSFAVCMAAKILPAPEDNLALAHDANQHVRGLIRIPAVRQFHLKPLKESLARKLGSDQGLPKASRTVAAQCVPHYLLKKVAQKMQMQGLFKVFGTGLDPELGFRNVDVFEAPWAPAERSRANKGEFER
jgi:hypothetical protein